MSGARWDGADLILEVRVQPRASADALDAHGGRLKIRITAPPVDGKANRHLVAYLAKRLGVARSAVSIESGESARDKRIRIRGADPEKAAALPLPPD